MHACTHAADVPYAGGAEVSGSIFQVGNRQEAKLASCCRWPWPGRASGRIFQFQGGRTEETRTPGVEERGGAVYVVVRASLSISSFLARCNVEAAAATSCVTLTHAYRLQPLSRHSARAPQSEFRSGCVRRPRFRFRFRFALVVRFRGPFGTVHMFCSWPIEGLSVNLKLSEHR